MKQSDEVVNLGSGTIKRRLDDVGDNVVQLDGTGKIPADDLPSSGGSGSLPAATGSDPSYVTSLADVPSNSDAYLSGSFNHYIAWTPTDSASMAIPLDDLPATAGYVAVQIWAGDVPTVDFPALNDLDSDAGYYDASVGQGSYPTIVGDPASGAAIDFAAGQPYTIVVSIYPVSGQTLDQAAGHSITLAKLVQALQTLGGVSPIVPYPRAANVQVVGDRLVVPPAVTDEVLAVAITAHDQSPGSIVPTASLTKSTRVGSTPVQAGTLGDTFDLVTKAQGRASVSYAQAFVPNAYMGPTFQSNTPSAAFFAAMRPAWQLEYRVVRYDGSQLLQIGSPFSDGNGRVIPFVVGDYNSEFNMDDGYFDWANPIAQVGSDLVLPTGPPWRVTTLAGGVFIITLVAEFE